MVGRDLTRTALEEVFASFDVSHGAPLSSDFYIRGIMKVACAAAHTLCRVLASNGLEVGECLS